MMPRPDRNNKQTPMTIRPTARSTDATFGEA